MNKPLPMTNWIDFAQARIHFEATAITLKPNFAFDGFCEGNYGYCHKPADHLVILVDESDGAVLRAVHEHNNGQYGCEMSPDPELGLPLHLPVCASHTCPFTGEPSPNSQPVSDRL